MGIFGVIQAAIDGCPVAIVGLSILGSILIYYFIAILRS